MAEYLDKATQCEILNGDNSVSSSEKDIPVISDDKDRRLSSLLNMFGINCTNQTPNTIYRKVTPLNTPSPVLRSTKHLEDTYNKINISNSMRKSPEPSEYTLSLKPTLPKEIPQDILRSRVAPLQSRPASPETPKFPPSLRLSVDEIEYSRNSIWSNEPKVQSSEEYKHPWL